MTERRQVKADSDLSEVDQLLLACVEADPAEQETVLESLCQQRPELAEELRLRWRLLGQVGFLENAAGRAASLPERIGGFRILRRIGGGGMGVVYLAEQEDLGRPVALKVLRPEFAASDRARERFRREGVTLSRLEHSGICPVYEVGEVEGAPYLAMRYLEGHTLAELIESARQNALSGSVRLASSSDGETHGESTSERARSWEILRVFEKISCAVHAAHEQGLVHRDLKPANVMIGADGEPVVLDFGLARDQAEDIGLTHSGDVLGTPAYLAPEQVEGRRRADERTDVYALGVTLCECLTLSRPFQGSTRDALYRQILGGDCPDVRVRNRHVPRDLAVVVAKAMDRNPERRYGSALLLAADLRRVRMHEPIEARPAGVVLRSWRWAQRNPVLAAFVLFLCAGLMLTGALLWQVSQARRQALALAIVGEAFKVSDSDPKAGQWLAVQAWELDDRLETRSEVYRSLARNREARRILAHERAAWHVAFSDDGRWLVSASDDATARVWNLADTQPQPITLRHRAAVYEARFLAKRQGVKTERVMTASRDGTARIWELDESRTGAAEIRCFGELGGLIGGLRFDPRRRLALVLRKDCPLVVDLERLEVVHELEHKGNIRDGAFSPDGKLVVTAEGYGTSRSDRPCEARVHRVADGQLLARVQHEDGINAVCFTPDGLLTGSRDGVVKLTDPVSGQAVGPPFGVDVALPTEKGSRIWCIVAAPQAGLFAIGGGWRTPLRVWEQHGSKRNQLCELRLETGVRSLAVAPDGASLLAACFDGTTRWLAAGGNGVGSSMGILRGHTDRVWHVTYSPDGRLAATASWDGSVRLWWPRDPLLESPISKRQGVRGFVVPTVEHGLVAGGSSRVWFTDGDTVHSKMIDSAKSTFLVPRPQASPSGHRVVFAAANHEVVVCDSAGKELSRFPVDEETRDPRCRFVTAWAGEDEIVVATENYVVRRYDLQGMPLQPPVRVREVGGVQALAVDVDRGRFALGGYKGAVVCDWQGRAVRPVFSHPNKVLGVAFSPDGRLLATACDDCNGRLFSLAGEDSPPVVLSGHKAKLFSVAFSPPNGELVATASFDGTVRIWTLNGEEREWARIETGSKAPPHAAWSPNGRWLWTVDDGAGVRRWPRHFDEALELARQRSEPTSQVEEDDYEARLDALLEPR